MLRVAADENFNENIVRGVRRRNPDADILCVRDAGLSGADDPTILAWAAEEGRVLLSHDVATITRHAYERVRRAEPMPGVFEVDDQASIGRVIEDILLVIECSVEGEWEGQVRYLPFR